jgi:Ca-activated chloride channel family protein
MEKRKEKFLQTASFMSSYLKKIRFYKFFPALYLLGTLFLIFSIIDLLKWFRRSENQSEIE